jgi:Flp pilus assembly protein CpaB
MTESRELALIEEIDELKAVNQELRESISKSQQSSWWLRPRNLSVLLLVGFFALGVLNIQQMRRAYAKRISAVTRITASSTHRTIPMLATPLEPGMIIRSDDVGLGPWPAKDIVGDILLSEKHIVGRMVGNTIELGAPIHASDLRRTPDAPPTDD